FGFQADLYAQLTNCTFYLPENSTGATPFAPRTPFYINLLKFLLH
ncbi:hypothetical protein GA0061102_10994, partial [Rhizobium miluonense]